MKVTLIFAITWTSFGIWPSCIERSFHLDRWVSWVRWSIVFLSTTNCVSIKLTRTLYISLCWKGSTRLPTPNYNWLLIKVGFGNACLSRCSIDRYTLTTHSCPSSINCPSVSNVSIFEGPSKANWIRNNIVYLRSIVRSNKWLPWEEKFVMDLHLDECPIAHWPNPCRYLHDVLKYFLTSATNACPHSFTNFSQIAWNHFPSFHTMSSNACICIEAKKNDIFNKVSIADINLL